MSLCGYFGLWLISIVATMVFIAYQAPKERASGKSQHQVQKESALVFWGCLIVSATLLTGAFLIQCGISK